MGCRRRLGGGGIKKMTKAGVTENHKINGCLSVDNAGCLSVLNDDMKIAPSIPLLLAQQLSNLNI